mmetsp:Transcript_15341/g.42055  ORF Transcript_15341/g.42055 Transcript_15341/m.42055 type:complete len:296 (+) Transcript_15341:641-1528(+)
MESRQKRLHFCDHPVLLLGDHLGSVCGHSRPPIHLADHELRRIRLDRASGLLRGAKVQQLGPNPERRHARVEWRTCEIDGTAEDPDPARLTLVTPAVKPRRYVEQEIADAERRREVVEKARQPVVCVEGAGGTKDVARRQKARRKNRLAVALHKLEQRGKSHEVMAPLVGDPRAAVRALDLAGQSPLLPLGENRITACVVPAEEAQTVRREAHCRLLKQHSPSRGRTMQAHTDRAITKFRGHRIGTDLKLHSLAKTSRAVLTNEGCVSAIRRLAAKRPNHGALCLAPGGNNTAEC